MVGGAWLIPAHAGKTNDLGWLQDSTQAHPRSRGENPGFFPRYASGEGSSPLTRGKRTYRIGAAVIARLIPAHAGKTVILRQLSGVSAAHPRSRGENREGGRARLSTRGSSPLTRGKLSLAAHLFGIPGLIPAHTGKTGSNKGGGISSGAHPRSRGEN